MQIVAKQNNLPFVNVSATQVTQDLPQAWFGIAGLESEAALLQFLDQSPNITQAGVVFYNYASVNTTEYSIWYNSSQCSEMVLSVSDCPSSRLETLNAVNNALIAAYNQQMNTTIEVSLATSKFPEVQDLDDLVIDYGPLFFICCSLILYISILYQIVHEKENFLRQGMRAMGLKSSMYWGSWIITSIALSLLMTLLLIGTGFATGISFFTETNVFVNFLVFFLFNVSMGQFALLCSTLMETTKISVVVSIMIVIVAMIFAAGFSLFGNIIRPKLYNGTASSKVILVVLTLFPVFHYSKAIGDITSVSFNFGSGATVYPQSSFGDGNRTVAGFSWDDLYSQYYFEGGGVGPPTVDSLWYQTMLSIVYILLTWYLDNVLSSDGNVGRKPYFFLLPEFWGCTKPTTSKPWKNKRKSNRLLEESGADEDVTEEFERARRSINALVRAVLLSKTFDRKRNNSGLFHLPSFLGGKNHTEQVKALQNLCLCVEPDTVMCLLGHNGAGKTTAFNLLSALYSPTSGDAFVGSYSASSEADRVRDVIGVCPQFDVLWNELTAREHLELFASLKRVSSSTSSSSSNRAEMITNRLERVGLLSVADKYVRTFSGGMKRRLSIAISCIGDPKVILLDEPTTGMDPLAKRLVWNLIRQLKKDRAIVLTTHSYEEAAALGDRIGILCEGRLRCIGDPLHLKTKTFGNGYRLQVVCQSDSSEDVERAKQHVSHCLPDAVLHAETGDVLLYTVSAGDQSLISFIAEAEKQQQPPQSQQRTAATSSTTSTSSSQMTEFPIRSYSISSTTLEEVFLEITRQTLQHNHSSE
eukprot:TRINITY_DN1012_c0_g1_i2.p1 TRINITY_DN1012_c0_g1~~TRINITY_DN1012_c0_g1_i2.p1  ORF type:complete len:812 (-),score=158.73 TRINITY_DN1012_c0_g1_i2:99-2534(-)